MPKKHQQSYGKPPNTYVHPSLNVSKVAPSTRTLSSVPSTTVNERLNHLRRAQASPPCQAFREEFVAAATQRSVPPALRGLLNILEPLQPRPRPGARNGNVGRRTVPGPAAPRSWTLPENGVRRSRQQGRTAYSFTRPTRLDALPGVRVPVPGSLLHLTMKSMAMDWEWQVEYYEHYLAALPPSLKSLLLSYVAMYGPGVSLAHLKTLFKGDDEIEEGTGSEEVKRLDLSGSIGHSNIKYNQLGLSDLRHYMLSGPLCELTQPAPLAVDSWEEEAGSLLALSWKPCASLNRFPNLTHLSLSHPGKLASWSALLSLSTHLGLVTHLSFAYWPRPTVTPNSLASSMISTTHPAGSVSLGGSNYYSAMDGDWHEAADILRRLSKNTYSLKWLDVEGCVDWFAAFRWRRDVSTSTPLVGQSNDRAFTSCADDDEFSGSSQWPEGPQWNNGWRHLEYVNLYQGWIPQNIEAIQNVESGRLAMELLRYLQDSEELPARKDTLPLKAGHNVLNIADLNKSRWATTPQMEESSNCGFPDRIVTQEINEIQQRQNVRTWLQHEAEARAVETSVRAQRAHGLFITFDHGWLPVLPK